MSASSDVSMPVIHLKGSFGYEYTDGVMTLTVNGEETEYSMKAKWRGGQTNSSDRHKRNFHIKILDAEGSKMDVSLLDMRSDNSWLMDAGQIDLSRIRNIVAHRIWRDMGTLTYYQALEKKARTYIEGEFCEVYINDSYEGIYALTEAIDRKQLKLMKYDEDSTNPFHGMLWKATGWSITTMWPPFTEPSNSESTWGGFEVKYPDFDDLNTTDWSVLYKAIHFVDESSQEEFSDNVGLYFDIPALIDYFVFHNVITAIDHGGKNMYWACYDMQADNPILTPAIWDYDSSMGQYIDDKNPHSPDYGPEVGNLTSQAAPRVLYRLVSEDVGGFVQKAINRYWELRSSVFSEDQLKAYYTDCFDLFRQTGADLREQERWSGDSDIDGEELNFADEQDYICDFIERRLQYLDEMFLSVSSVQSIVNDVVSPQREYNVGGVAIGHGYKGVVVSKGNKSLKIK